MRSPQVGTWALALLLACTSPFLSGSSAVTGAGLGAAASNVQLFVSPTGTGATCSSVSPCLLSTARSQVSGHGTGTINFQSGTYRQATTLALTGAESGQTWQAVAGATPTIIGSIQVTGWSLVAGQSYYKASVPAGSYSRQLYVNGTKEVLATGLSANYGTCNVGTCNYGPWANDSTGWSATNSVYLWPDALDLWVRGHTGGFLWVDERCPISAATSSHLTTAFPCRDLMTGQFLSGYFANEVLVGISYLENALELLDTPGEFYLDSHGYDGPAWTLYYWPRPSETPLSGADVELPVLTHVMSLTGANNFAMTGLTLKYSTWIPQAGDGVWPMQGSYVATTVANTSLYNFPYTGNGASMAITLVPGALQIEQSSNVTLLRDTVQSAGAAGISVQNGSNHVTIDTCIIADVAMSGVQIGDIALIADRSTTDPRFVHDNTLTNYFVVNAGTEYWSSDGVQVGDTTNTKVLHGEVLGTPYGNITVGSLGEVSIASLASNEVGWNLVQGSLVRAIRDGGSIYDTTKGTSLLNGDYIHDNVMSNNGGAPMLYMDHASSYNTAIHNVAWNNGAGAGSCPFFLQNTPSTAIAKFNVMNGEYSDYDWSCTGTTYDASNSVGAVAHISSTYGIYDPLVSSYLAAAGTNWRGGDLIPVPNGTWTTASSSASGFAPYGAVDGTWTGATTTWQCASAPCWLQQDLLSSHTITAIEVMYEHVTDEPAKRVGYSVLVSNDPTFATSTTVCTVDSSGDYQSFYLGGMKYCPFSDATKYRYVRLSAPSNVFDVAELYVNGF